MLIGQRDYTAFNSYTLSPLEGLHVREAHSFKPFYSRVNKYDNILVGLYEATYEFVGESRENRATVVYIL